MIPKTADRIKELRELNGLTQSELAKHLSVTRSSVNAWEMDISTPSIERILDLSDFFHVSTDYLLGRCDEHIIDLQNYDTEEKELIYRLLYYFDLSKK